jgi:hypothetical protein
MEVSDERSVEIHVFVAVSTLPVTEWRVVTTLRHGELCRRCRRRIGRERDGVEHHATLTHVAHVPL